MLAELRALGKPSHHAFRQHACAAFRTSVLAQFSDPPAIPCKQHDLCRWFVIGTRLVVCPADSMLGVEPVTHHLSSHMRGGVHGGESQLSACYPSLLNPLWRDLHTYC